MVHKQQNKESSQCIVISCLLQMRIASEIIFVMLYIAASPERSTFSHE